MPHGFDTDAKAIDELFRRLDNVESQMRAHADNVERTHGHVNAEMSRTRPAMEEARAEVSRIHREITDASRKQGDGSQ